MAAVAGAAVAPGRTAGEQEARDALRPLLGNPRRGRVRPSSAPPGPEAGVAPALAAPDGLCAPVPGRACDYLPPPEPGGPLQPSKRCAGGQPRSLPPGPRRPQAAGADVAVPVDPVGDRPQVGRPVGHQARPARGDGHLLQPDRLGGLLDLDDFVTGAAGAGTAGGAGFPVPPPARCEPRRAMARRRPWAAGGTDAEPSSQYCCPCACSLSPNPIPGAPSARS